MRWSHLLPLFFSLVGAEAMVAQASGPVLGLVWEAPASPEQAWVEMAGFREMGVEALRMPLVPDPIVYAYADTLGLQLYLDLPLAYHAGLTVRDTLAAMAPVLEALLDDVQGHTSVQHIGLARYVDTSDPSACAYFEAFAARVHARGPNLRAYYVTPFSEDDACAAAVDLVLLDTRNAPDPAAALQRWPHETPVGLGAMGVGVDETAARGLRVPHSQEAQARYLEVHLNALRALPQATLPVVFLYRWKDFVAQDARPDDPYGRHYGLIDRLGVERPAATVFKRMLLQEQTVFAFKAGPEQPSGVPWLLLLGWVAIVMSLLLFRSSPRFRHAVPRYFLNHGFFRDAVREGRDVLLGPTLVLLAVQALAMGLVGVVFVNAVHEAPAFVHLLRLMPETLRGVLVQLTVQPLLLLLLLVGLYTLALVLWSLILTLYIGGRSWQPQQALMLAVWPRWWVILLLVGAMVVSAYPETELLPAALWLVGLWTLLWGVSIIRTLYDFIRIARLSGERTVLLLCTNPLALFLLALLIGVLWVPDLVFLWHLVVRA